MRTSVTSLSKKFISTFFAATLALGLVPAAAFAADDTDVDDVISSEVIEDGVVEGFATDPLVIPSDSEESGEALTYSFGEDETTDEANGGDDVVSIPAATQRVNEDVTLTTRTVAQAESTRSYFLAQTLESTRTVPIVSANLPLDMTASEPQAPEADAPASEEGEEGEGSDDPDPAADSIAIAAESIVVGSFEYRGITYAVEPGGESVAVAAADYSKLPEEFIEAQTIVLPSVVSTDGLNYYSVTRIADHAFASLTAEAAVQHVISSDSEKSALLIEGREAVTDSTDDVEDKESSANDDPIGITAITIPASITEIGDDAFTNFDTLQYVIVSEDNPNYGMYDGCLYDAELTSLLLIPEGRLGAVRIAPSVTSVNPEVFSHCPLVDTLVAAADSAAYQLFEGNDSLSRNKKELVMSSDFQGDEDNGLSDILVHLDVLNISEEAIQDVKSDFSSRSVSSADPWKSIGSIETREEFLASYVGEATGYWVFWNPSAYSYFYIRCPNAPKNDAQWSLDPYYRSAVSGRYYYDGSRLTTPEWTNATDNYGLAVSGNQTSGVTSVAVYDWRNYRFLDVPAGKYVTDILTTGGPYYLFLNGYRPSFLTGYIFDWNVSKFGGSSAVVGTRIVDTNNQYSVATNGQDGQETVVISSMTTNGGAVMFPQQTNLESGARFLGWTNHADGSEPSGGYFKYEDGVYTVTASAITREGRTYGVTTSSSKWYAVWETEVEFDARSYGGEIISEGGEVDSLSKTVLNNVSPTYPELKNMGDGWTFRGWTVKDENGVLGVPSTTAALVPNGPTTFYAVWGVDADWAIDQSDGGAVDESVHFTSPSGATGTSWSQSDVLYGTQPVGVWPVVSDREGYLFAGWRSSADGKVYGAGDAVPALSAPTTFTTVWSAGESDVTFAANLPGRDAMDKVTTIHYDDDLSGVPVPAGAAKGNLDGYVFAGYFDRNGKQYYDSEGTAVVDRWDKVDENVTLYAHWKYKVYFDKNDSADATASLVKLIGGTGSETIVIHDEGTASPWIWATYHGKDASASYPTVYLPGATRTNYGADAGAGRFSNLAQWTYANGAKSASAGMQLEDQNALVPYLALGSDGVKSVTLAADWQGVATRYPVRLVAATSFPGGAGADAIDSVAIVNDSSRTKTVADVPYGSLLSAGTPDTAYAGAWRIVVPVPEGEQHVRFAGYYGKPNATASDFRYINADGTVNASNRVLDRSTLVAGAVELYARWEVADYSVSFVLTDADAGQDSKIPDDIVDIRYGDGMPELAWGGSTSSAGKVPTRSGYAFRGYFDRDGIQYYDHELNKVSDDVVWRSAYDVDALYARWTYEVALDMNLGEGARGGDAVIAKDGTVLKAQDAASQTYAVPATERTASGGLDPFSFSSDATKANVVPTGLVRTRGGEATGYAFRGFTTARDDADTLIDAAWIGSDANPSALLPKNGRSATIYALWEPLSYDIVLDYKGGDAALSAKDFSQTGVDRLTDVMFDARVLAANEALAAPHRLGYRFSGYYDAAGVRYLEPAADDRMVATNELWSHHDATPSAPVTLYAHYEQIVYRIDFDLNGAQPADASKVDTNKEAYERLRASGATDAQVKAQLAEYVSTYKNAFEANKLNASRGIVTPVEVTYGQSLAQDRAEENGIVRKLLPEPASGTDVRTNFWCDGYTFAGWYYIPEKEDGTLDMENRVRYSSTSADGGARLVFDREVETADGAIPSVTLYALWNRNSYSIRWNDHGRLASELDLSIPYSGDVWEVMYGSYFSPRTPAPYKDRPFSGSWYTAASGGTAVGFAPYKPASTAPTSLKSSTSYVEYFADWSRAQDHVLHFYGGDGGAIGASPNTTKFAYEERKDLASSSFPFRPNEKAGYGFVGWLEAADEASALAGEVIAPNATPIRNLSEMTAGNGKAAFPRADAHIYLVAQYTTDPYMLALDTAGGDCTDGAADLIHAFDRRAEDKLLRLPDPDLMRRVGYDFSGWEDENGDVVLAYDARTNSVTGAASFIVEEDGHLFVDADGLIEAYENTPDVVFSAGWETIDYTIRFHMAKPGSAATDSIAAEIPARVSGDATSPSVYSFPYPHGSSSGGRVFYYWGAEPYTVDTSHAAWTPGSALVFDPSFIEECEHVTGADRTIDLYAEWNGVVSATVPLRVTIAIAKDDGTDNMRFGNAYLSTSFDNGGVEVLSVEYEKVSAADGTDPSALGTDDVFGSVIDDVNLTVRAYTDEEADAYAIYREGAFTGNLDGTSRKSLADASLKIGLSAPGHTDNVWQGGSGRALGKFGFAPFSKNKRLNLIYGLEYTGGLTHQQFVSALRLPDANDVAANSSHSRQSYPIAKLFYTIGLAS